MTSTNPLIIALFIEDDAMTRDLIEAALQGSPINPVFANTLLDGIAVLQEASPDVCVLDLRLPDCDPNKPMDAIKRVMAIAGKTPIIICSASIDTDVIVTAIREYGVTGYIPKHQLSQIAVLLRRALALQCPITRLEELSKQAFPE